MTLYTDDFERADGVLTASANWAQPANFSGDDLKIYSGFVVPSATNAGYARWSGPGTPGRRQKVTITLGPGAGGAGANSNYACVYWGDGHGYYRLRTDRRFAVLYLEERDQTGSGGSVGASISIASIPAEGDTIGLEVDDDGSGNNLFTVYFNGVQVAQRTHSSPAFTSGVPAVAVTGGNDNTEGVEAFSFEDFVVDAAPTFTSGPTAVNTTQTATDIQATIDEDGTIYAVAVADGAPAPSSAQVKAGQDSTGSAATATDSTAATADTQATMSLTGLSSGTDYDVYVVAEDGNPNLQASPTLVNVTTADATRTVTMDALDPAGAAIPDQAGVTAWVYSDRASAPVVPPLTGQSIATGELTLDITASGLAHGASVHIIAELSDGRLAIDDATVVVS